MAETTHNDAWAVPAALHILSLGGSLLCTLTTQQVYISLPWRPRENLAIRFPFFSSDFWEHFVGVSCWFYTLQSHTGSTCSTLVDATPGKWWTLLEINSTVRLAQAKGDYCCMALSYFLVFQRQSSNDKWNSTPNGELLAAKLQTLDSVIVHSGNIYMTNKKNFWQKNLSCTCLVLSLSSQFYLAFNHIALHVPSSSQSTKISLISLHLITMWDNGFWKLSVKYDISQQHKVYAQNSYITWNSTKNSRIILKAEELNKITQKIQSDG